MQVLHNQTKIVLTTGRNRPIINIMFRATFSFLLIANLLACPLRCAACDAAVSGVDECAQSSCSCCQDAEQSSTGCPEDCPHGDCSCPNCVCEGATLEDEPTVEESMVQAVDFDVWPSSERSSLVITETQDCICENTHCLVKQCGRDALIAHQTWLI